MEHRHHGKSSEKFLDTDEILRQLDFKGDETFMDAGCGDGHISIRAIDEYLPDGCVYAIDFYKPSIEDLKAYKNENDIENLIPIEADITKTIHGVEDESVDVILLVNVIHGFNASGKMDDVIDEISRITKSGAKVAIVEFKPIETKYGPPVEIRFSPEEVKELFTKKGFKMAHLNEELGNDIPEGKSHFLIIFEKE